MTQIEKPTVPSILENESAIEIEPKNILEFLAKNKPRENRERAEDLKELGLIQSFEQKVVDYKNKLKEKGLKETDAHELAMNYGEELKYSQQDPREYVGLMNRAGSSAELGRELTRAIPEEEKLTRKDFKRIYRLDLDLDDFKLLNDYYGHLAGNEILRVLCKEIMKDGEAVTWLRECGALEERKENDPPAFQKSAESSGEEFAAMAILKKEIYSKKEGGLKIEVQSDNDSTAFAETHDQIIEEFSRRLQIETKAKFREVLQRKDEKGDLIYPRTKNFEGLPDGEFTQDELDNFIAESGVSIGFANAEESALEVDDITENDTFDSVIGKIKGKMLNKSDKRARHNKDIKKETRVKMAHKKEDNIDSRITAYISPRGKAETMKGINEALQTENKLLEDANKALQETNRSQEDEINELKARIALLEEK